MNKNNVLNTLLEYVLPKMPLQIGKKSGSQSHLGTKITDPFPWRSKNTLPLKNLCLPYPSPDLNFGVSQYENPTNTRNLCFKENDNVLQRYTTSVNSKHDSNQNCYIPFSIKTTYTKIRLMQIQLRQ